MIEMDCSCVQKHHSIPTEVIEVSEGAIEKTPDILKDYHRIFLVADENTYAVAGRRTEEHHIRRVRELRLEVPLHLIHLVDHLIHGEGRHIGMRVRMVSHDVPLVQHASDQIDL